jgi:hypothetical protein
VPDVDGITDPHEVLLAEVAAARTRLRALVEHMRIERLSSTSSAARA